MFSAYGIPNQKKLEVKKVAGIKYGGPETPDAGALASIWLDGWDILQFL